METTIDVDYVRALEARIDNLEGRIGALEHAGMSAPRARRSSGSPAASSGAGAAALEGVGWTTAYRAATLEVPESWIELHEHSARPQLQRLIREVVEHEGPVTDRLVLDRVRRAWGLKRAGGRVQEAFDQAVRQLLSRGLVVRDADALTLPGVELDRVRVPRDDDEASRRAAEDVPLCELALALERGAAEMGEAQVDDLTMRVAKLFGWTRRGGAIQERLDAALEVAVDTDRISRAGALVRATHF